jgi:hypothetical protein
LFALSLVKLVNGLLRPPGHESSGAQDT